MNKFFGRCLRRLVPLGLAASAAVALLAPAAAYATPYVVTLTQQGANVVAIGSGEFDLIGLTFDGTYRLDNALAPNYGYVGTGPQNVLVDGYSGPSGPTSFGSGNETYATTGTGDGAALNATSFTIPLVFVPQGYVSGSSLANNSTWDNASFASLGVTPGTYVWTWGTGADQSFTLDIGGVANVPEPATLGMFGFGVLLLGAFVGLRRRMA